MKKSMKALSCCVFLFLYGCSLDDKEEIYFGSTTPILDQDDLNENQSIRGPGNFDFTKVSANGSDLSNGAEEWSCVRDNKTNLMWEVKSLSPGLHYANNTYSWYNSDPSNNGGFSGLRNGGSCLESICDTQGFVDAVNQVGLCGYNDWRVPTRRELVSIVDYSRVRPTIKEIFFPNSQSSFYWSSTPGAAFDLPDIDFSFPWHVGFDFGYSGPSSSTMPYSVRLVREN